VNRRYRYLPALFIILVIFFIFSPRELYKIFLNEQRVEAIQNIDGTAVSFMRDFSAKHQVVFGRLIFVQAIRWQCTQSLPVLC